LEDRLLVPITLQRGLLVAAAVLVPGFGVLYRMVLSEDYDPFVWRIAFSVLCLSGMLASYRWQWVADHLHEFILFIALVLDVAIIGLAGINGFSGDRAIGVIVTVACIIICFRNSWETLAYACITSALTAVAYTLGDSSAGVGQPVVQGSIVSVTVMIGLLNESRRQLQLQLEHSRADLEIRVAARTEELAVSMVRLEGEIDIRRQAESEAMAANRAKSAFLANMSHELRTPLNAIIGYTEMLVEEAEDRELPEFLGDLSRVRRAATHLLSMIGYILDLTAIETGKLTIHAGRVEIRPVLEDVEQAVRLAVDAGGSRATWECDDDVVVLADPERLRQILLNLVSNAAKFTEQGTITVRAWSEGARVFVSVQDTGIGIPEEAISTLFDDFTQVDGSSTRRFDGTGMGLAISRRLARALDGDVVVDSRMGRGTTVTVDLPRWQTT
jgi:signal transduction histidine kinase